MEMHLDENGLEYLNYLHKISTLYQRYNTGLQGKR
jgi:hypothetical protein